MTPAEILTCDVCRLAITDLTRGMVFFDDRPRTVTPAGPVLITAFRLAHKGRCDVHDLDLSLELDWLADPATALYRLADMTISYRWPAEYLDRLVQIAWAVSAVASPAQRRGARRTLELLA